MLKTKIGAPRVTNTPTTTRCRGAFVLKRACSRTHASQFTSAAPKPIGGDIFAIPVCRSWSALNAEFRAGPSVSIVGKEIEFFPAQLTLIDDSVSACLHGRFRILGADVLIVEGEIIFDDSRHVRLVGPHVIVLGSAA